MADKLRCARCSQKTGFPVFKPVPEFYPQGDNKRGYQVNCKHCKRITNREYRERHRNTAAPVVSVPLYHQFALRGKYNR